MTKYCVVCDRDVEKIPIGEHEYVFFDIVQATTIMLGSDGLVDKKPQSTSYLCEDCRNNKEVRWDELIHHEWGNAEE